MPSRYLQEVWQDHLGRLRPARQPGDVRSPGIPALSWPRQRSRLLGRRRLAQEDPRPRLNTANPCLRGSGAAGMCLPLSAQDLFASGVGSSPTPTTRSSSASWCRSAVPRFHRWPKARLPGTSVSRLAKNWPMAAVSSAGSRTPFPSWSAMCRSVVAAAVTAESKPCRSAIARPKEPAKSSEVIMNQARVPAAMACPARSCCRRRRRLSQHPAADRVVCQRLRAGDRHEGDARSTRCRPRNGGGGSRPPA